MRSVLSENTISSIRKTFSLKRHVKTTKTAFLATPEIIGSIIDVFKAAPYLIFVYIIIAGIDLQYRLVAPASGETMWSAILLTIILLTVANGLSYIEAYNTHTTGERVSQTGRYVVKKTFKMTLTLFLSIIFIISGFFLLVFPGIYLGIRLSLAAPACVIDDLGVRESITQSMRATSGQTLFTYITLGNLGVIVAGSLFLSVVTTGWIHIILIMFSYSILPPILHVCLAILYLNGTDGNRVDFYENKYINAGKLES